MNACLFMQGLINSGIWKDLIKTKQDLQILNALLTSNTSFDSILYIFVVVVPHGLKLIISELGT